MTEHFWRGMIIIFLGGLFNGSFASPMKRTRRWAWENTWLIFSVVSLIFLPWLLAGTLVPELKEVYRGVPGRALFYPLGFGFLWGIALLTYGLGIRAVGMGLAIAIVAGLSCLSGSLIPLLVFNPADLFHPRGLLLIVSMPVLFLGLGLYGKAGYRREKEQPASTSAASLAKGSFAAGLAICIFTGIFGSSINLGFAFSGAIVHRSLQLGASQASSTYAVWALVLGAGFVPNLLYCLYLLFKNHTWSRFAQARWSTDILVAIAMALLWLSGVVGYGIGTTLVGVYGTSLGFALLTASQILSSNALGIIAGEWKATSLTTKRFLAAGVAFTLVSVVVLSLGGVL